METCSCCKKEKPDARLRVDPYEEDINNRIVEIVLCDECTKEYENDI